MQHKGWRSEACQFSPGTIPESGHKAHEDETNQCTKGFKMYIPERENSKSIKKY